MISFSTHHGSPGNNRDFFHLKILMPNIHFIPKDRPYPENKNELNKCQGSLGYSFGCVDAIIQASLNTETKLVVLIAPYFFPFKKSGAALSYMLNNSFFKNKILPSLAQKKINQMLIDSSHPHNVPGTYREDAKLYVEPNSLAHSMIEKNYDPKTLFNALDILEKRNIPIHIVYGQDDKTSNFKIQLAPLEKYKNLKMTEWKNAGHALLWTHTEQLAVFINKCFEEKNIISSNKLGYYSGIDTKNNVASFLEAHKSKFPDRKILTWANPLDLKNWTGDINAPLAHSSVTVAELDHLVGILANEFQKNGIKFGDRVILFLPMSLYMYASMFALQKMGAIPTFLDSWARRDQMGASAKVATPTAMISGDRAFSYLSTVEEINNIPIKIVAGEISSDIKYSARLEVLMQSKEVFPITAVEKEHTALITFTTGSSGTPKGADRSHRFLAAQHYALNRNLPYDDADKDLPVFPIFSLNNLAAGVETVIPAIDVGSPSANDAALLYTQMKYKEVTCTTLSPSLFNSLASFCIEKKLNLDFLKRVVTGGAPVSRDDVLRMKSVARKAQILVLYGSTEVEPMAEIEATEMLTEAPSADPEIVEAGVNVGHIDSGLQYRFIKITKDSLFINSATDWKNLIVSNGEVGELIVAGEHVCEKYFNNEEAFFRAKIRDENGIVWHRTGDLGKLVHNNLWIVGRVHNAINRSNQYFFPVRAEIILKRFSFVQKAAFLGIPDPTLNEKTYAVFTTEDKSTDIEKAKKEIQRVLEKNQFMVDAVIHVDDIPMDPRHHSKVEYDVLRKSIQSRGIIG